MSLWWYVFFAAAACWLAWLIFINIDYWSLPKEERHRLWLESRELFW